MQVATISLSQKYFNILFRWRYCSGLSQQLFPEATSHLYMKSFTDYDRHLMVLKVSKYLIKHETLPRYSCS